MGNFIVAPGADGVSLLELSFSRMVEFRTSYELLLDSNVEIDGVVFKDTYTAIYGSFARTTYYGSGFTVDVNGNLNGGIIYGSIDYEVGGTFGLTPNEILRSFGMPISAAELLVASSSLSTVDDLVLVASGLSGNDLLQLSNFADDFSGFDGNDTIYGNDGADTLAGGAGDDLVEGGVGPDSIDGGDGSDTITGGVGDDLLQGGGGLDTAIYSGRRSDYTITQNLSNGSYTITDLRAIVGDGIDTLYGVERLQFAGSEVFNLTNALALPTATIQYHLPTNLRQASLDSLDASAVFAVLSPQAVRLQGVGSDYYMILKGSSFAFDPQLDSFTSGNITSIEIYYLGVLSASAVDLQFSADELYQAVRNPGLQNPIFDGYQYINMGSSGDDFFWGGDGSANETIIGNDGLDTLSYQYAEYGGISANLLQGIALKPLGGLDEISGVENLVGSAQADHFTGNTENNHISGFSGADTIYGGAGDDTLIGDSTGSNYIISQISPAYFVGGDYQQVGFISDINSDGVNDVISAGKIVILPFEIGGGSYPPIEVAHSFGYQQIVSGGDFNGDGFVDIFSQANVGWGSMFYLFLNDGLGGFVNSASIGTPSAGKAVVGDLNGDGRDDIVAPDNLGDVVRIYLADNSVDGLAEPLALPTGGVEGFSAVVDWNGDGLADVFLADPVTGATAIANGADGLVGFTSGPSLGAGIGAFQGASVAIDFADLNQDGLTDVVVGHADGSISVFAQNPDGSVYSLASFGGLSYGTIIQIELVDLNADGISDLVALAGEPFDGLTTLLMFSGLGGGSFVGPEVLDVRIGGGAFAIGDLNSDGILDVARAVWGSGSVVVLSGGFGPASVDDVLFGDAGNDSLDGGYGYDALYGGLGDDTLDGGAGIDTLDGGEGSDTYILKAISDMAVTEIVDSGLLGVDELRFAAKVASTLTLSADDAGLERIVIGTGSGVLADTSGTTALNVDAAFSVNGLAIIGNAGKNTLTGSVLSDSIEGGAGEDFLLGGEGNDFIVSGFGRDTVYGGGGDDVIDSSLGTASSERRGDVINPGLGSNLIIGNAEAYATHLGGLDLRYDNLEIVGGISVIIDVDGFGTVTSGDGRINDKFMYADNFVGTGENDSFVGGNAIEEIFEGGAGDDYISGGSATDAGEDYASYTRGGTTGIIADLTTGQVIDQFGDSDTLVHIEGIDGSDFDDFIRGNDGANLFFSYEGNDTVAAGAGNDFMDGGGGNDVLDGGDGIDVVRYRAATSGVTVNLSINSNQDTGGAGFDTLISVENLVGSSFDDVLSGNSTANRIEGGAGSDVIDGGAGADTLDGGDGSDIYMLTLLTDKTLAEITDTGEIGTDELRFAAPAAGTLTLLAGDIGLERVVIGTGTATAAVTSAITALNVNAASATNGLLIIGNAGTNTLTGSAFADTLDGGAGNDVLTGGAGIDTASYASATGAVTVSLALTTAQATIGAGTDTLTTIENLTGSDYNDNLAGSATANRIDGGAGNDVITGGAGIDTLDGGADSDIYLVTVLADKTAAEIVDTGRTGIDELRFAATAAGTLALLAGDTGLERIVIGTGAAAAAVTSGIIALNVDGTSAANGLTIVGNAGINTLMGSTFADTIDGGAGNDVLNAGAGNDSISGGAGNDTINDGIGTDTIDGGDGVDTLRRELSADYGFTFTAVVNLAEGKFYSVEAAEPFDTLISIENVDMMGSFDDIVIGSSMANQLSSGGGHDSLYGADGNDTLIGGADNDTLDGGAGNDMLTGDAGTDTASYASATAAVTVSLTLTTAQNTVGAGTDTLTTIENLVGSGFNDILSGSATANRIDGGAGNDVITGGAGIDTLDGGADSDIYVVTLLADKTAAEIADTGATGTDELRFAATAAGTLTLLAGDTGLERVVIGTGTATAAVATATTALNVDAAAAANGLTIIGNAGVNTLTGSASADTIDGGAGNDLLIGGLGNDSLIGGAGIDTASYTSATENLSLSLALLTGQSAGSFGTDTFSGVEHLTTGSGNDSLIGDLNANTLDGGAGNDTLDGGAGNDVLTGGAGTDTASYASATAAVTVSLALTTAQNTIGAGTDTLTTIENLRGSSYNDILTGSATANRIDGGAGNDVITGGAGIDTLDGGADSDIYVVTVLADKTAAEIADTGATGTDELRFAATAAGTLTLLAGDTGLERVVIGTGTATAAVATATTALNVDAAAAVNGLTIIGNAGVNTLTGSAFADTIDGGAGNDVLLGGAGTDTASYATATAAVTVSLALTTAQNTVGAGTDTLSTIENLTGSSYNDILIGSVTANRIDGGAGNDVITGGAGIDTLDGGEGSDIYVLTVLGEKNAAEITDTGATGTDELRFAATAAGTLTLFAGDTGLERVVIGTGTAAAAVTTGTATLSINAASAANGLSITGNAGVNTLTGSAFADTLEGGLGNDVLNGGAGNDRLAGGNGNDMLTGGAGADAFVFNFAPNATTNRDTIVDFVSIDDTIELARSVMTGLGPLGTLNAADFRFGAGITTAGDATDRIIYNTSTGTLYYDADGTGAGAAVQFAQLNAAPTLSFNDFIII